MNLFFGLLAAVGGLLVLLGRRLIIEDARGFSTGWVWAIRCLPLADLMYLARFWDSAKTGAFMSLAGLVLILPSGGKALWDRKHAPAEQKAKGASLGLLDADMKNGLFTSMKAEHEERTARKKQKLDTLNARLGAWYQSMEARRPALANATPAEVAGFNDEAAAYMAFRKIGGLTLDELTKLQAKQFIGWSQIPDTEYREYYARMSRQEKKPSSRHAGWREAVEPEGAE